MSGTEVTDQISTQEELSLRLRAGSLFGFVLGITFGGLFSSSKYPKSALKGVELSRKIMKTTVTSGVIGGCLLYIAIFIRFKNLNQ